MKTKQFLSVIVAFLLPSLAQAQFCGPWTSTEVRDVSVGQILWSLLPWFFSLACALSLTTFVLGVKRLTHTKNDNDSIKARLMMKFSVWLLFISTLSLIAAIIFVFLENTSAF